MSLQAIGGALKPSKCFFQLVGLRDGNWQYQHFPDPPSLTIIGDNGHPNSILFKPHTMVVKVVGVWQAPNESMTKQLSVLHEQASSGWSQASVL
eukprot:150918-Ditylum_brightwellii.AAC.1